MKGERFVLWNYRTKRYHVWHDSKSNINTDSMFWISYQGNPTIFIESTIHAREWVTVATATYFLNELLTSKDPAIVDLAQNYDWVIIPVFNVDGYAYTHNRVSNKCAAKIAVHNLKYSNSSPRIVCGVRIVCHIPICASAPIQIVISMQPLADLAHPIRHARKFSVDQVHSQNQRR